jgi:2',3'-cyclic-nucleotide 2'-phosphodiesterase (5'-nucleotidase family)
MKKDSPIILLILSVLAVACSTTYTPQSVDYVDYRVQQGRITDSSILHLLSPYSSRLSSSMNEVIAQVGTNLEKRQPEGTLGNLMADVMLATARKNYKTHVDAAFMNYGGIRLTQIPVGPLTRGKLFELSPFDNVVVLLEIRGKVLRQFLDHIAGRGGWPVSGLRMSITGNKASGIEVGGKPLNEDAQYTIAVLDYNANGGDDCNMLINLPRQNNGLIFRSQLEEYFAQLQKEGKSITASVEGRVTSS